MADIKVMRRATAPRVIPDDGDAALIAVVAHGMLNVLAIVQTSLHTIDRGLDTCDRETIRSVIATAARNGDLLGDLLCDLVRQGPDGLDDILVALNQGDIPA